MSDDAGADPTIGDEVRADLLVAGTAAASAVALSLVSRVLFDIPIGPALRLAPLGVYPLYLLFGRGDTGSAIEDPRPWAAASVLVALVVFGIAPG
ncbi:MAG: hypothetical protein ABEH40_02720 [Haloferacaceae archaeon]